MKSKITKIQEILKKGIALFISAMMTLTPIAYAATSLDDSSLNVSLIEQLLYGTVGATAKEIEEWFSTDGHTTLYINNEIQLRALAEYVNSGNDCSGKVIKLQNDIYLNSNEEWVPIGKNGSAFSGVFEGNSNTIYGMRIFDCDRETMIGLFGIVSGGTVKNVKLSNAQIIVQENQEKVGLIAGTLTNAGKIINCKVLSENNSFIKNVYSKVGGIVGTLEGGSAVKKCFNAAGIYSDRVDATKYIGGIVGISRNNRTYSANITECFNIGKIEVTNQGAIGGILGGDAGIVLDVADEDEEVRNSKRTIIKNCTNSAEIDAPEASAVGGIAGYTQGEVENCVNTADINACRTVGGIVGSLFEGDPNNLAKVINCRNEGTVNVETSMGGGIVGIAFGHIIIQKCYNKGNVIDDPIASEDGTYAYKNGFVGGIVGHIYGLNENKKSYIDVCINEAEEISGYDCIGGIVGVFDRFSVARSCINYTVMKEEYSSEDTIGGFVGKIVDPDTALFINDYYTMENDINLKLIEDNNTKYNGIKVKQYEHIDVTQKNISYNHKSELVIAGIGYMNASEFDINKHDLTIIVNKDNRYYGIENTFRTDQPNFYAYVMNKEKLNDSDLNANPTKSLNNFTGWNPNSYSNIETGEIKNKDEKTGLTITTSGGNKEATNEEAIGTTRLKNFGPYNISGNTVQSTIGSIAFDYPSDYGYGNRKLLIKNGPTTFTENEFDSQTADVKTVSETLDSTKGITVTYEIKYQKNGETSWREVDLNSDTKLKSGDKIKVIATFNNTLYKGQSDITTGDLTAPAIKINDFDTKDIEVKTITTGKKYEGIYTIAEEAEDTQITEVGLKFIDDHIYYVEYKDMEHHPDHTPYEIMQNNKEIVTDISKLNTYIDTTAPTINTKVYVENALETERYTAGKEILIEVKTNEEIKETYEVPEIQVSFSKSGIGKYNYDKDNSKIGYAKCKDAWIDFERNTTGIYSYIIQEGDEGFVSIEYKAGEITDLAGNVTDITSLEYSEPDNIYADTTAPIVKITADKSNPTNADVIKYTFTWSEELAKETGRKFEESDITVNNGTKGTLSTSTDNGDGTYSYTMDVTTNVEKGNVGDIQVIVEQNACQDLVGHSNVRTESVIRIDKKAPILIGLEAYASSEIALNKDIDVVKENYRVGEEITIVATFDENIASLEENGTGLPELALQFSESGNAEGKVNGRLEGNKIIYTYKIVSGDEGTLSVKGFTGTVVDAAGNETRVTKRALDGDTIIADTCAPSLKELNVTTSKGTYKANNTIFIEAIYSEDIYTLENNEIKNIVSTTAPTLKYKFGNGEEREAIAVGYGRKENGTKDKSKVIYTCTVVDGDNGILTITSYENKENIKVCDIAGNEASLGKNQTGNEVIADTIRPQVTNITASVENPSIANTGIYHKAGNTIKIELTFSEKVSGAVINPIIKVGFSDSRTVAPTKFEEIAYESDWNVNTEICEFSYVINNEDNGYLWVQVPENQYADEAGNKNIVYSAHAINNIYADTTPPNVTLLRDTSVEQNNQRITIRAQFSENIYDLNNDTRINLAISNAPKLVYSFGTGDNKEISPTNINGDTITYKIEKDPVNDNGTLRYELAKGNLCDRAGNLYYEETTDTTAPELEGVYITTNSDYGVYCKKDVSMYVTAMFNEEIANQNMKLKVKLGEGQEKELTGEVNVENKTEVIFKYKVEENDNGKLTILDVLGDTSTDETLEDKTYGYVEDIYGNRKNIFNFKNITITGEAIADTIAPTVTITSNVEKTNQDKVTYTFTWSESVKGFTAEDIEVINGYKGEFTVIPNKDGKEYTLEVDTTGEGRQIVKVNANVCIDVAGNSNVQRATYNQVVIDYTKPEVRAKVNGGNYVLDNTDPENKKSTLKETIVVNEEVSKFEYIWSKSETLPTEVFTTINPDEIQINSDIKLEEQVKETGTYYLYMKVTDVAGNDFVGRTTGFEVNESNITLTPSTSTTTPTNQDVIVTVQYGEELTENRKAGVSGLTQSADASKVIITENGTVYAEATDIAGNKVCKILEITNIDKTAPKATISYKTNEDGSVTATITFDEEASITNNENKNTYTFAENGEFIFEFVDSVGNKGTATAKVTSINKEEPTEPTEPTEPDTPTVEEDKTAPEITFNYTTTTATVGTTIGATITSNEDAIISYSWDNQNWTSSSDYVRSINVKKTQTSAGTYTLYAKAKDKSSNTSSVSNIAFTVVNSETEIKKPEIVFEDLTTIQKDGVKYVKVTSDYTTNQLNDKMDKDALLGYNVSYKNLTSDNKLKTGSEIIVNGTTKYIVVVNGDVNCDGKVDFLNDIVMINNYRIGINRNLRDIQILAGDINNSGTIEFIPDIVAMNNYRLGRIKVL